MLASKQQVYSVETDAEWHLHHLPPTWGGVVHLAPDAHALQQQEES